MSEIRFRLFRVLARIGLGLLLSTCWFRYSGKVQAADTLYVNAVSGNDAYLCTYSQPCQTITRAIDVADNGDTIRISAHTYNENLVIDEDLELIGQSAKNTIVDGQLAGAAVAVTGSPGNQPQVYLRKMTCRNGTIGVRIQDAQVILTEVVVSDNVSDLSQGHTGGGIKCLSGSVNAVDTTVTNNQANFAAGVLVDSGCALSMSNSTIYLNQGIYASGLDVFGSATLINVTISLNQSTVSAPIPHPGGVMIETGGSATLNHCTVANNHSFYPDDGWQIWAGGSLYLKNSIVQGSGQPGQPNCRLGTNIVSLGYNLSSDDTCNLTGTGDLTNTDALLYALAGNGGPTFTHGLPAASPAVDAAGPPDPGTPTYDQRGLPHCDGDFDGIVQGDMGAFEYQPLHIWLPLAVR